METMRYDIAVASLSDLSVVLHLQKECYRSEAVLYEEYDIPPLTQTLDSIEAGFPKGCVVFEGHCR